MISLEGSSHFPQRKQLATAMSKTLSPSQELVSIRNVPSPPVSFSSAVFFPALCLLSLHPQGLVEQDQDPLQYNVDMPSVGLGLHARITLV